MERMTTANDQIACPECGYGWNEFTHGFHYTHCSKVAHLNHEQITYQCPNCGQVDSHTDECPSNPQRYEHDTPAAPERGDDGVNRYLKSEIEHLLKENSTLIAQRERLLRILSMTICHSCHNRIGWTETPTKYGDWTKCNSCREARAVLTTSEQEGSDD